MKIKTDKRFKVLEKTLFDGSVIERIYEEEVSIVDPNTHESSLRKEKFIDYKIIFLADLRIALNNEFKLVRASLRTKLPRGRYPFFSDLENANAQGVIAALYAKNDDIATEMFAADRDGLIFRSYIDLFKNFDNFKLRNAKRLSDKELFGTIQTIKIVRSSKIKKRGKNKLIAQKSLTTLDKRFINSENFTTNYENSIGTGADPAEFLFATEDVTPADPRKAGTFVKKSILTGNYYVDGYMTSLRYNSISSPGSTDESMDRKSVGDTPSDEAVAVQIMQPNRTRIIELYARIRERDIVDKSNIFALFDIADSRGIIYQTLVMKINHNRNVEDYYTPASGIQSKITFPFDSNKASARISLKKDDPSIAACDIYIRSISEISPLLLSRFRKVKRVTFGEGSTCYNETFRYPVNESFIISDIEDKMTMMRVVPISKTGKIFGNFSSSVRKNGPFVPYRAAVYTSCGPEGITVRLSSPSRNVVGVCFERRDITLKERNFSKVIGLKNPDPNSNQLSKQGIGAGSLASKGGLFQIHDKNCKEGHLYEYRARLYLIEGVVKTSIVSRFETFITPIQLISSTISDIVVEAPAQPPLRSEISNNSSPVAISFNIDFELAPTDADKVLLALESAGLASLYTEELSSIKSSLQNLIFFNIQRFNANTGETFYLGTFPQGGRIVDDGIISDALGPILGQRYVYRATPCLVQPDVAVQSISAVSTNVSHTNDLRNPAVLAKLRNSHEARATLKISTAFRQAAYTSNKLTKNFSRSSLEKGTIPTSRSEHTLEDFSTGDYVDIAIATGYQSANIKNIRVTIGNTSGPIISWRVYGTKSAKEFIDFFIILSKKQGQTYLAGTCHKTDGDKLTFIDFKNKDFIGKIEYSIKPVFLDGKVGKEIQAGFGMMVDRSKKFRRSN